MKYYLGGVKGLDENIGRFTDFLKERDLYQNTVVVYSSDQGFFLGQKNLFDKRWMYDPCMRMPLIIRFPGIENPGTHNNKIVLNIDFAPTLLDMAGIQVPHNMQGRSMMPLINNLESKDWRTSMYYRLFVNEYNVPLQYGIRTENFKLIHFKGEGSPLNPQKQPVDYDRWELIDLMADPDESTNLADVPEYQFRVEELQEQLYQLREQLGDSLK